MHRFISILSQKYEHLLKHQLGDLGQTEVMDLPLKGGIYKMTEAFNFIVKHLTLL